MAGVQIAELKREVKDLKREVTRSHSIIDDEAEARHKLIADLESMAEEAEVLEKSRTVFRDQNTTLRDQNKVLWELVDALTLSLRHIAREGA